MVLFRRFETAVDAGIGRRRLGYLAIGLIICVFLWFPNDESQSNYAKTVFISGFFYAIMSSSWALLAGIAGQFSFGHMAFMGIGRIRRRLARAGWLDLRAARHQRDARVDFGGRLNHIWHAGRGRGLAW